MMTSKLIQINICNILCLPSFKTSIKKQTSNTLQKQTQKQSYIKTLNCDTIPNIKDMPQGTS